MLYEIVNEFPHELFQMDEQPCISIYQPTHRHRPENEQDLIRFNNLMKEVEQSLKTEFDRNYVKELMEPLEQLAADRQFWEHATEGLALFANETSCIIYQLHRPVKQLAIVASSFHIKPLIRVFQSADRYHLLGLNRSQFTLFEGNRYGIEEIFIEPTIESTIDAALGEEYAEKTLRAGTYSGDRGTAMFHGQGSKKDVLDQRTERFFRYVDREIINHYSQPMELPLYLVALDEYHTPFQTISHNSFLQDTGIKLDYTSLTLDDLQKKSWEMIEPFYLQKTKVLVDRFQSAQAKFQASSDIAEVARAAVEGRISEILLESDRIYPGRIDQDSGELIDGNLVDPQIDDVLDDLAEIVSNKQGEVVVVPKERMPSKTGVAATFRY